MTDDFVKMSNGRSAIVDLMSMSMDMCTEGQELVFAWPVNIDIESSVFELNSPTMADFTSDVLIKC